MDNSIVNLKKINVYQQKRLILREVDLQISKGEFVYLIGKTGSGKSSLLKTLYGALPIKEGSGLVAGFDLSKMTKNTIPLLRRKLGIVFQDFNLLTDRNVEDNLKFVLSATAWKDNLKIKNRINEVLEQVGLTEALKKMPHELSGGEQQRIVIARALLNQPELIIADEPTGNLDPETSDDILLLMRELANINNTAVFFATHDYRILENFPARIVRCINERVYEDQEIEL